MNKSANPARRKKARFSRYGEWALVTGASSGIGRALAREIARGGMNVVLVSRQEDALNGLKQELEKKHGISARVIVADLAQEPSYRQLIEATKDIEIGLLVPNAGMEITGEFIATDLDKNLDLLRLNMLSALALAHGYGAQMAKRKKGAILFLSSTFAFQGVPYVASYAASKSYILLLGEALAYEMARHNVDVTVLAPGMTRTNMPANMPVDFSRMPMKSHSPEYVARFGLRKLGRKYVAVPGIINRIFAFQNRLMPRSFPVKMFGGMMKKALTGKARLK